MQKSMTILKKLLPDVLAVGAFVLLSLAYFFPADTEGRVLWQHDTTAGVGAGREASAYYEATGERTRWTNSIFGGMPTYQISPSYDSARPLAWMQKAYRLFLPEYVWLTFVLMLGFHILLRAFGLPPALSALGGVLWAFSSYFFIIISAGHIWKFVTLAYIPPTLAGVVLAYRGRLLAGGALAAVFTAFQVSSNHVQMSYYFLPVILLFAGAYLEKALKERTLPRFLRASAVLAAAALIGACANLPNLYHTYKYSKETMRGPGELVQAGDAAKSSGGGLDRDYITQWSYGVGETWTLLVPDFKGGASVPLSRSETAMRKAEPRYAGLYGSLTQYFGDQPMTSGPVYVGAFVLFLFLMGCFVTRGPLKWALVGGTLLSVALSWGKNFMPLTDFFIDHVPMYDKFRAVSSILVVAEFCIPLLAVFALKKILDEPRATLRDKTALGVSMALTLGVSLLLWMWPGSLNPDFVPAQESQMLRQAADAGMIPPAELSGILANLGEMRAALVSSDAMRSFLVVAAGLVLLWLYAAGRLRRSFAVGGVAVLCLADMWGVNKRYLNDGQFVPRSAQAETFAKTRADELILQDTTPDFRVLNLASNTFNENNTAYWHKSIGGYHAAKLRRYQEMIDRHIGREMQAVWSTFAPPAAEAGSSRADAGSFRVLNMLNTRYFIFPSAEGGETVPVRNPFALGNAWFVDSVRYVDNANLEIDALADILPGRTAVADKRFRQALKGMTEAHKDSLSAIRLTAYAPNRLTYETQNAGDGVAVFSEIYYPDGWQVTVDGQEAELARADYILRALYVPAGRHTIGMRFEPRSLRLTEGIAYAAVVLLLAGAAAAVWAERKRIMS